MRNKLTTNSFRVQRCQQQVSHDTQHNKENSKRKSLARHTFIHSFIHICCIMYVYYAVYISIFYRPLFGRLAGRQASKQAGNNNSSTEQHRQHQSLPPFPTSIQTSDCMPNMKRRRRFRLNYPHLLKHSPCAKLFIRKPHQ